MDLICEVALTTIKKGRSWLGQLSNRNGACGHVVEPSPEVCEVCLIEGPKIKKRLACGAYLSFYLQPGIHVHIKYLLGCLALKCSIAVLLI